MTNEVGTGSHHCDETFQTLYLHQFQLKRIHQIAKMIIPSVSLFLVIVLCMILIENGLVHSSHIHLSDVMLRSGAVPQPDIVTDLKNKYESNELSYTPNDAFGMIKRTPNAFAVGFRKAKNAFIDSMYIAAPAALLFSLPEMKKDPKLWLKKGIMTGASWSKVSALYSGGEGFFEGLRGKKDRYNTYLGSGLASATMRFKEGPLAMAKGFGMGYGFLVMVDSVMKKSHSTKVMPVMEEHGHDGDAPSIGNILLNTKSHHHSHSIHPEVPKSTKGSH